MKSACVRLHHKKTRHEGGFFICGQIRKRAITSCQQALQQRQQQEPQQLLQLYQQGLQQ